MNSYKNAIQKYQRLNQFAEVGGTAILGGCDDLDIPVDELKKAAGLDYAIYNRSVAGLTAACAPQVYDECVASLRPSAVLLHLGEADVELFEKNPETFVQQYRETIAHIRSVNKKCQIAVISLKNDDSSSTISAMNAALSELAKSERCSFEKVESHRSNDSAASFVYSIGFVGRLSTTPIHVLSKTLYCWNANPAAPAARRNGDSEKKVAGFNFSTVSLF